MPNKTICFFNSSKSWGGGEKWHYDNAVFLSKKEYNVFVFTNKKSQLTQELNKNKEITNVQLKVSNFSFINPIKVLKLRQQLKKINPDFIIINLPSDLKLIGITSLFYTIPNIIYRRGSAIPIKNSFLNRFLFKKVITGVIANSIATKKTILQNNKSLFPEGKIKVIYNGISIENFQDNKSEKLIKKSNHKIILGHIGRFSKEKNQQFLINVALKLKEKNIPFKLLLGGDGPDFEKISDQIEKNKLTEQVKLLGFIGNANQFLNAIDVFLLPSIWEGFGYVTIEAMACTRPVIAFEVGSNPEIIINNTTGFLVKLNDLTEFADKIIFFSENRPQILEMGMQGKKRAKDLFNIDNSYKELELYLNSL